MQRIYRLRTPVDTSAVLSGLRHLVSVHPALRTRLVKSGREWQQAFPALEADISGVEVRDGNKKQRAAYARYLIAEESAKPFDLRTEPPCKVGIIRVDQEHLLSLCVDHIAADDLALDVLEREWTAAYIREANGLPHSPSGEDQAFWNYLSRESALRAREARNLEYWQTHLAGAPLGCHEEEEISWVAGDNHQWQIVGDDFQQLTSACKAVPCSVFAAALGAQIKLAAELGQTDEVVVNVPVSNRSRAEDHNIIANLSMLLHLRFLADHREPPAVFIRRVRDGILEAMAHRQYDYANLSRAVAADAASRGKRAHWLHGCSYIIERGRASGEDSLFLERLDNQPGQVAACPHTAFTVAYHQSDSRLHCAADWDPSTWRLGGPALAERYTAILDSLLGTSLRAKSD